MRRAAAFAVLCFLIGFSIQSKAEDAAGVLKRAAAAMGVNDMKTLRYAGSGSGASFGQAYKPGMAWPRLHVSSYVRLVDYENAAYREESSRSRAERTGGGALPLEGEQRVVQLLRGDSAWNQAGPASVAAPVALPARVHELWTTPHGVLMAAMKRAATVSFEKEKAVVSFVEPGAFSARIYLDENFLVERIESRHPHPVTGDTDVVSAFSEYRNFGNLRFPMRIRQAQGGYPVLDLQVAEVQKNAPVDIQVPELVKSAAERVTSENVAPGVWFLAGGSHNSVAIEMKDHLVLIESPLYDGRALAVIEAAKKLAPGKPLRYVVNSHSHFDHAGGLRAAAAQGATLVVQALDKPYFEKVFAIPNRIAPDALAKSGRKPRLLAVREKHVMDDGARRIELYHQANSVHSETFLFAWLPKERLLIEADSYTPSAPNSPPPSPVNANHANLVENIEALKLAPERILPLHGRIAPASELYRMVGKAP